MNKIFVYIIGAFCILIILLKIIFAAFFPKKFSEGARDVLFINTREKALFPSENQDGADEENIYEEWDYWIF